MAIEFHLLPRRRSAPSPWASSDPIREELFSTERLEEHARSLAGAQPVTARTARGLPLAGRLAANGAVLLDAYTSMAKAIAEGRAITPAAEWLIDNFHLIEQQIRGIRLDLPPGYYRQLPKLATGPFGGYPRVFGMAWAFVAHTDSQFGTEMLLRYVRAYQSVQPLTIGELWAVSITLRIVLIENLRRLAQMTVENRDARQDADAAADRLLGVAGHAAEPVAAVLAGRQEAALTEAFAVQMVHRLRDQDPTITPALTWLDERLAAQGTTADAAVREVHRRQGASNVTVRNIITSLRLISDVDWEDLFEQMSLVDGVLSGVGSFRDMDFPTRNLYRSAIEDLARGSGHPEIGIASHAAAAAKRALAPSVEVPSGAQPSVAAPDAEAARRGDPGYHLLAGGREALEAEIGFRTPWYRWPLRAGRACGIGGYAVSVVVVSAAVLAMALGAISGFWSGPPCAAVLAAMCVLGAVPAIDAAVALVNRAAASCFRASLLPAMELRGGIPSHLRTLVAVPTLLTTADAIAEQVGRLEIHHLASPGGDLHFALLSDWADAAAEHADGDGALLEAAQEGISALNRRYGPAPGGDRFLLLHRHRVWNRSEARWMGWERKRGKLHEMNRLLRGADDTTFMQTGRKAGDGEAASGEAASAEAVGGEAVGGEAVGGEAASAEASGGSPAVPSGIRYVVTLDADTRLPRDTVHRLIGKMAHPLNQPRFDPARGMVVEGYGVLQPRVTPSLPVGSEGSLFQRAFSSDGGVDPYASAVSDVYQDLFGQGSYAGKGIYDVDAFEASLAGRVPDSSMLSHDLFEGSFARSGTASDVEVVEEFPARYDVNAIRHHRWARGDWQLLPWILGRGPAVAGRARPRGSVPAIGRWKMADNLRRSLSAPAAVVSLAAAWTLLPVHASLAWTVFVVATIALPPLIPVMGAAARRRPGITVASHLRTLGGELRIALGLTALTVTLLADQAALMGDAIARTLWRLCVTRRHLLEWVPAAQASIGPRLNLGGFYRRMAASPAIGMAALGAACLAGHGTWPLAAPFAALWIAAPAVARQVSRAPRAAGKLAVGAADARALRLTARRTWRFFETFVTAADHMLPPDNFQEVPDPVVAHRTSPTNIGLYLLSVAAARDFGWIGTSQAISRLDAAFATLGKMARFRGHFYNWYDTGDLRPLDPEYVSSVDSGNLAGHLIALANACREWRSSPPNGAARLAGAADAIDIAREETASLRSGLVTQTVTWAQLDDALAALAAAVRQASASSVADAQRLADQAETMADIARAFALERADGTGTDMLFWVHAGLEAIGAHRRDLAQAADAAPEREARLLAIEDIARSMAYGMDFGFLFDRERRLLSIGYRGPDGALDEGCYDLLASEARLASFLAVAKGDIPASHWFRLGRSVTLVAHGAALISWSGSMFEYLMPSLVLRAPAGSLLGQTNRLIVRRQIGYGAELGVPWGISESAYNARDLEFTYQYSNFGVPGLGLKRGLGENTVIAPYATALAAMADPAAASANLARLADAGARGPYGFYEALDYTPVRLPAGERVAIVRAYMAHHQGMTIAAIADALLDGVIRARFHAEPAVQASELLLQERTPRETASVRPWAAEIKSDTRTSVNEPSGVRRFTSAHQATPPTLLLSNGRYTTMITSAGSGYSRWDGIAVTRWREDATCDGFGSYIFIRDIHSGETWSAGFQPSGAVPDSYAVAFHEDRAEFVRHDGTLATTMDVLVSAENDSEVRRVSIANLGSGARECDVTSYAELVLAPQAADAAHPAFSKLFVQTEYIQESGVILATRRKRDPAEPGVWAAHLAVADGETVGGLEFETDRARFLGRGHGAGTPSAESGAQPLSNTAGTVLDPVFALRRRVRIAPGATVRISFWTMAAATREALLGAVDKHRDRTAYGRATTLAWTQAQVQLHHLGVTVGQASMFQRLAGHVIYTSPPLRPSSHTIRRGAGPQHGLWAHGISGDLPIVLLRITDAENLSVAHELLLAHEYWKLKHLAVDIVIMNERQASYVQDLQAALEALVRTGQSRLHAGGESAGRVFVLRADLVDPDARALIASAARAVLVAQRGSIADQMNRIADTWTPARRIQHAMPEGAATGVYHADPDHRDGDSRPPPAPYLEFFNGLGGFADGGKEYVTILGPGQSTPTPWVNVIANPEFGFLVPAGGGGFTWSANSRENQITPWGNDPVTGRSGEAFYIKDDDTGDLWSPTAFPIRGGADTFTARHGRGFSRFGHTSHGVTAELLQFVPLDAPVKVSRLVLTNRSGRPRHLSVTGYAEWVLGPSRQASLPFVMTGIDPATGAMFARNPWSADFGQRTAFIDMRGRQVQWTGDRREFIGRNGSLAAPAALGLSAPLSGAVGAGLDPCGAMTAQAILPAGGSAEVVFLLGEAAGADEARRLVADFRTADLDAKLAEVVGFWDATLGAVQAKTPDRAMDIMLNGWLVYQTLACRVWARSAFYQASGAYGFRDQLQDGMALAAARPELTREHILRAAGRQFTAGDVQHWWLPQSGRGVRTRISDDRVWLAHTVAHYVGATGDAAVLDERVPYLEGQALGPDEHENFFLPTVSEHADTLFAHCALALDRSLALGGHGLPLIGTGDWNDGMNRVGERGAGESVWLGWLLYATLTAFAPLADARGDAARAETWRAHASALQASLEREAWDGGWYRRGFYDDGTPLGSAASAECRIDSIAQSWAVLSGAADPERAAIAMAAVDRELVRPADRLALLFAPPFDRTPLDPGYIKGYPPGIRENGGQYTHAAAWSVMALAALGDGDRAASLFSMLNPINHARTRADVLRYKVEPYAVAADIYAVPPHVGRGGWTWYTGSAGWLQRAGVESILGLRLRDGHLHIEPCIPKAWPGFGAVIRHGTDRYDIQVENGGAGRGIAFAAVDREEVHERPLRVRLAGDGAVHTVQVRLAAGPM